MTVVSKEFINIEKTLSDAPEDGCTSNTNLNALDQFELLGKVNAQ